MKSVRHFSRFGKCLTLLLGGSACVLWACSAHAEGFGEAGEKIQYGEVTGTVSAVNKMGIAVEYSRTRTGSSEMYLPLSDRVRLERLRSLAELQPGATVKVRAQHRTRSDSTSVFSQSWMARSLRACTRARPRHRGHRGCAGPAGGERV